MMTGLWWNLIGVMLVLTSEIEGNYAGDVEMLTQLVEGENGRPENVNVTLFSPMKTPSLDALDRRILRDRFVDIVEEMRYNLDQPVLLNVHDEGASYATQIQGTYEVIDLRSERTERSGNLEAVGSADGAYEVLILLEYYYKRDKIKFRHFRFPHLLRMERSAQKGLIPMSKNNNCIVDKILLPLEGVRATLETNVFDSGIWEMVATYTATDDEDRERVELGVHLTRYNHPISIVRFKPEKDEDRTVTVGYDEKGVKTDELVDVTEEDMERLRDYLKLLLEKVREQRCKNAPKDGSYPTKYECASRTEAVEWVHENLRAVYFEGKETYVNVVGPLNFVVRHYLKLMFDFGMEQRKLPVIITVGQLKLFISSV